MTALHIAAANGHLGVLRVLLHGGASVDATAVCDQSRCTPEVVEETAFIQPAS